PGRAGWRGHAIGWARPCRPPACGPGGQPRRAATWEQTGLVGAGVFAGRRRPAAAAPAGPRPAHTRGGDRPGAARAAHRSRLALVARGPAGGRSPARAGRLAGATARAPWPGAGAVGARTP